MPLGAREQVLTSFKTMESSLNYSHLYTDIVIQYEMLYFHEERGPEAEVFWAHGSHDVAESHCYLE